MIQVEWNKEHSWKVTKKVERGVVVAMKFDGEWFHPMEDSRGYDYMYGSRYIASDCCDYCALEQWCKANNPINHACEECGIAGPVSWH